MPPKQHHKKNEEGTDDEDSLPPKSKELSPEVRRQVDHVATILILMAAFIMCMCLLFLVFDLVEIFAPQSAAKARDPSLYALVVPAVLGICLSFFILKVALDFRRFKKWIYSWVRLLTLTNWGYIFRKELYDEQVRRAFDQPEYEYPKHPEYGYKLEDKRKDSK